MTTYVGQCKIKNYCARHRLFQLNSRWEYFRFIGESDSKQSQSQARPRSRLSFISAMRITMLLFHPVPYRVGHHRHRSLSARFIHVILLHSHFTLVALPRYYASEISTTALIFIESNFFHGQQREPYARQSNDKMRSLLLVTLRIPCVPRHLLSRRLSFPFLGLAMTAARFDPRTRMECEILTTQRTTRANEIRCKQPRCNNCVSIYRYECSSRWIAWPYGISHNR